jgi:UDP-2,3-diacylglucosamine pyrophosphatase LpxH
VNAREDVAELVILGDMLDDWVETVENPPHTFQQILASPNNAAIIAALRSICTNPALTVTYVTGNHDLLSCEAVSKTAITNAIPGLRIVSDLPGLGSYSKTNLLWGEHGHRYCMFNAPDIWSRTNGHLPLGYFISRIAASKSAREGTVYTTMEALDTMVKSPGSYYTPAGQGNQDFSDAFIHALFDAFALVWGGYWPWDTFKMDGLDNFTSNPSIDAIGSDYDNIYSGWPNQMDAVNQYEAIWNELGHLDSAANLLFEMPDRIRTNYPFVPRIVLFGHTHEAAFSYHCGATNTIYANTGTWIDGKPRTWVEVEINHAGSKDFYTVSLWFDGESAARQSATLEVPMSVPGSFSVAASDFDGDRLADSAMVDSTGNWHVWASGSGYNRLGPYAVGGSGYAPLAADFDGDGLADPAAVDAEGNWYIWSSLSGYTRHGPYPTSYAGCIPLAADFDGDGLADPVMIDSAGNWYVWFSRAGYSQSGPHLLTVQ